MQKINNINKNKYLISLLIIFIIIAIPFSLSNRSDTFKAKILDENTIGYYQSNTCKISLTETLTENIGNNINVYINNADYPGLECFGKITGVDKVNNLFFISVGTNSLISFILQSFIWIILLYLFSKKREENLKLSFIPVFTIPLLFTYQLLSEERFYENSNIYYKDVLNQSNYYILSYLTVFFLISLTTKDMYENRKINFFYILPFMYLFSGTYMGMNINFYIIIFCFFGLQRLLLKKTNLKINLLYIMFSIIWIINKEETNSFFDGDKIRGFINSSNNLSSTVFWIIVFYLLVQGLYDLFSNTKNEFNLLEFKNSFLISGSLLTLFGLIGASSYLFNFLNFFVFGQNKRGMKNFDSVVGGAWRGFAPSAEYAGEFFAICLLISIYYFLETKNKVKKSDVLMILLCAFSLFKSNNFAAISSFILFTLIIYLNINSKLNFDRKKIFSILIILITTIALLLNFLNYEVLSHSLVQEAILHSNLFEYSDSFKNDFTKKEYFEDKDYKTLMQVNNNSSRSSSSLILLIELFTPMINIPIIPNVIGLTSAISILINRTELWGIFIAKYNPNITNFIFGYGPFQISNYLYDHKVELDVPEYRETELFLPHSSVLDGLIFFGFAGILLFIGFCLLNLYKNRFNKGLSFYIFLFVILNMLKSDSFLYIPSFTLFIFFFFSTFKNIETLKK